ncbi:G-type lectin S-receptor-like serine/threonine-protein kinase At5g35370 [Quercus suber]|uniref:G-type lectin S-receptor-like serine/threonine-protein kinase At5g35370 n=1 Tax=Quercus suber TaxID=58331 RepID=UPI0032E0462E
MLRFLPSFTFSASFSTHSISPNFTASHFQFNDTRGAFLRSQNGTFKATIDASPPSSKYYFSIVHSATKTIIWSANRDRPMSSFDKLSLTVNGLTVTNQTGQTLWSTPQFNSDISAMQLSETGNLVLVDAGNNTLWESFDHPTDTIVMGQRIPIGKSLQSAVTDEDMSVGDYQLEVTDRDVVLQWNKMNYWESSMDPEAVRNSNKAVSLMVMNGTGLYLLASDNSTVVEVALNGLSSFRSGKLGPNGRFSIVRPPTQSDNKWEVEFARPFEDCDLPLNCKEIGLCTRKPLGGICSCLPEFSYQTYGDTDCMPANSSLSLPSACTAARNGSQLNSSISYIKFGPGMDYFANNFREPVKNNITLSVCKDLCSQSCSCLGFFHEISSGSCYLLENHLGSFMLADNSLVRLGYIKVLVRSSHSIGSNINKKQKFSVAGLVLLNLTVFLIPIVFVIIAILWLRKKRLSRTKTVKLGQSNSLLTAELEMISIPGLPRRFDYEELAAATENFKNKIGHGGFGTVYRGTLTDQTIVAVKKITSSGVQGKKEFYSEISIIGNIRHVNLVRLIGFCAQGKQRFLVLEYMNRGLLDSTLFGDGPVLQWGERVEIALGTARGLAYLHSECEQRIIHCDVKPENILLHDNLQVKISDFGISKLISREQSTFFTTMRGTRGYLAPEWMTSSAISNKVDVYSYGMVLLEIVRGRRNCTLQRYSHITENDIEGNGVSSYSSGSEQRLIYFPRIALDMHVRRRYLELADPRLEGGVSSEEIEKLVRIALCCLHQDPALRPTMANVVGMLEGGLALSEPRVKSLHFLRAYGQRFTETTTMQGPTSNGAAIATCNSLSYTSSQQLSGPR